MEASRLRKRKDEIGKILTARGSGDPNNAFDYIALIGAEGDVIACDEKMIQSAGVYIEPYETLFGRGFCRLIGQVFDAQTKHSATSARDPVGALRAIILSFEKQVVSCRVFENDKESVALVGVTTDASDFTYRHARELWDRVTAELRQAL